MSKSKFTCGWCGLTLADAADSREHHPCYAQRRFREKQKLPDLTSPHLHVENQRLTLRLAALESVARWTVEAGREDDTLLQPMRDVLADRALPDDGRTCKGCGVREEKTPEKTLFGGLCGKCDDATPDVEKEEDAMTMIGKNFVDANILRCEVETNCPRGGDSGHGGVTRLVFENGASTDMRVEQRGDTTGRIVLVFRGDTECFTLIDALEWAACELRRQVVENRGRAGTQRARRS